MSSRLRVLLLGSMAIAFVYLLVHAREPLRLNIGDPWSDANVLSSINYVKSDGFLATSFTDILDVGPLTEDSYRYIHYPPLSEIFYGAVGKFLGVSDIGTFRLFGLMFSVLAMWLMYSYVRRLYSDRIALIAIALFSTSLIWLMYADSMHQAPVMQCTGFLALWGLVRAIETKQKRHYAAAFFGSCACFLTSYDYFLFLPAAVLMTVYLKAGNPFAKGNRHFVALCAAGCALGIVLKCMAVIGAVGWPEFVADLRLQFFERATSAHDRKFTSAIPTMTRRLTMIFTPFVWITFGYHVIKAIRAPNLTYVLRDTAVWLLLAALAFLYVFRQLAASQMLASQVLLPFYAIGSALVIEKMLDAVRPVFRYAAWAWLVAAPLWGFYFMFTHPRSMLDRDDVAKTNEYLAKHDRNDFLMSNLLSDGHIQASFDKHYWAALDAEDTTVAALQMVRIFELTGTDYVHEVIFTEPNSRFIDKSLWPLAMPRGLWSVTGWPFMHRAKTNSVIKDYDRRVMKNLVAVKAQVVQEADNYTVYRVDRATVMELLAKPVPVVAHIDFGSIVSHNHVIMGWSHPYLLTDGTPVTSIGGFGRCPMQATPERANACKTVLTKYGLKMKHEEIIPVGQLMLRLDKSCDTRLTFRWGATSYAQIAMAGFTAKMAAPGRTATFTIPAANVKPGINILEIENLMPEDFQMFLHVSALAIEPMCAAP